MTSNFGPWVTGRFCVCMIVKIGKLVGTGGKGLNFRHDDFFEVIEEYPGGNIYQIDEYIDLELGRHVSSCIILKNRTT